MMRRLALMLLVVTPLAGCGGGSEGAADTSGGAGGSAQQTVSVSETEFSLDPSTLNIAEAGTVTFKVTNDGQTTHALELEGNGVEAKTESIEPGASKTLTVQFEQAGSYEIYCPIDGHKDKGMEGELRVGGSAGSGTTTEQKDDSPGY